MKIVIVRKIQNSLEQKFANMVTKPTWDTMGKNLSIWVKIGSKGSKWSNRVQLRNSSFFPASDKPFLEIPFPRQD